MDNLVRRLKKQKCLLDSKLQRLIKIAHLEKNLLSFPQELGLAIWQGQLGQEVEAYLQKPDALQPISANNTSMRCLHEENRRGLEADPTAAPEVMKKEPEDQNLCSDWLIQGRQTMTI